MPVDPTLRDRISLAVCSALNPHPDVLAGWEGGSAAFSAVDAYSDIDLHFVVSDAASLDALYALVEDALSGISPITVRHAAPPGRYYKLQDGGDFLLVDVCFFRAGASDHFLEVERHGNAVSLFDKGQWLHPPPLNEEALAAKRAARLVELQAWFPVSQSFVRKAILRGHHIEALAAYWACTLKPLTELVRMRYCPHRWDFGMRYLTRDLPSAVAGQLQDLAFVTDIEDLKRKLTTAESWAHELLWPRDAPH